MATVKDTLEADLHAAMKARDEIVTSTLRMALTAVRTAEVAGRSARKLTDQEVLAVLAKEAKKRREAAVAFAEAGRAERAEAERAEEQVLARYLPVPLSESELAEIVAKAIVGHTVLGPAIKAAQAAVAGRAEGGRVAAEVRRQLAV